MNLIFKKQIIIFKVHKLAMVLKYLFWRSDWIQFVLDFATNFMYQLVNIM